MNVKTIDRINRQTEDDKLKTYQKKRVAIKGFHLYLGKPEKGQRFTKDEIMI